MFFFCFFFFFLRNAILFTDQNTYTTYNANIILTFTFKLHYSYLHYRYYLQNIMQYPHTIRLYNTTFRAKRTFVAEDDMECRIAFR